MAYPRHRPTLGHVDSLEVGVREYRVREHPGLGFWKPRCEFPNAWAPDIGPEPGWLAWHCCSLWAQPGPALSEPWGGGGAELAATAGTDSPGRKPRQARQDFWG